MEASVIFERYKPFTGTLGLQTGKVGDAIILLMEARHTGNSLRKVAGEHLLHEVISNWASVTQQSFEEGFAGIGWGIEWLAQNKFLPYINTDELLEEVDDLLYNAVVYSEDEQVNLLRGTIGKLAYFIKREWSLHPGTHRHRRISNQECIVLLTDDIAERMIAKEGLSLLSMAEILKHPERIKDVANMGYLFNLITTIPDVNKLVVEQIIYKLAEFLERFLKDFESVYSVDSTLYEGLKPDMLLLASCFHMGATKFEHKIWKDGAAAYLLRWTASVRNIVVTDEQNICKWLVALSLALICIPSLPLSDALEMLLDELGSQELPPQFLNGLGTVSLVTLAIKDRNMVDDWCEILPLTANML